MLEQKTAYEIRLNVVGSEICIRNRAQGKRVVGTRWVCCNKGDRRTPDVRCRLVCQEVKTYQSEAVSYTYLTLPTKRRAELYVVPAASNITVSVLAFYPVAHSSYLSYSL